MFNYYKDSHSFKENRLVFKTPESTSYEPPEKEREETKVRSNTKMELLNLKTELTNNTNTLNGNEPEEIKQAIASDPNTPPETLNALTETNSQWVKFNVANNPNTPPETLNRLAQNPSKLIQKAVASNLKTPDRTLSALAENAEREVSTAARNTLLVKKPYQGT